MYKYLDVSHINKNQLISNSSSSELKNDSIFPDAEISKNLKYIWFTRGATLEVYNDTLLTEYKLFGSFDFSTLFSDATIEITYVTEYNCSTQFNINCINLKRPLLLLVALKRSSGGSIICLIDVRLSVFIRCFETPFRVSIIIPVRSPQESVSLPLSEELNIMKGIIAIGTEGGLVGFVDLLLDVSKKLIDFLAPSKVKFIVKQSLNSNDLVTNRKNALIHDQHPCLPLNSDSQYKGKYIYRSNDGNVLDKLPLQQVTVTSLYFNYQTNSLFVGYNFGGFQIWNVSNLNLECSCALEEDLLPVIKFAFQEPENDPRDFCYFWVIRGIDTTNMKVKKAETSCFTSGAFLYALYFEKKQWLPGLGNIYSGYNNCTCRFEYYFTNYFDNVYREVKSFFISCETLTKSSSYRKINEDEETIDTSLIKFIWDVYDEKTYQTNTFIGIFDLNQWYQAQMPSSLPNPTPICYDYCSFFSFYQMNAISDIVSPDLVLDVKIYQDSIKQFKLKNNHSDICYFPVSLSFDFIVVSENRILSGSFLGLQKQILNKIFGNGPNELIEPNEAISLCVSCGLLSTDKLSLNSAAKQRAVLLTLALNTDNLPFIIKTIELWSSGDYNNFGCSLNFLLDWIWKYVSEIKALIDSITEPLFTSSETLDESSMDSLYTFEKDLNSMNKLLHCLCSQEIPVTDVGLSEMTTRLQVTQLITDYLSIILWSTYCGLLPEWNEFEKLDEIRCNYEKRRNEISSLDSTINSKEILIIDNIINYLPSISNLWCEAKGNGSYPPPTLHSLIGIYLSDEIQIELKHCIFLYFIFELLSKDNNKDSTTLNEKLMTFPSRFNLKPGLIKFVQGIWALDHKSFDFAFETLVNPMIKEALLQDLSEFYHIIDPKIVKSFLYQNECDKALRYSKLSYSFVIDTLEKIKIKISLLLANNKLIEAFDFQRQSRNKSNIEEILLHFFYACEQMQLMENLFKLPLDLNEEDAIIYYLLNISTHKNSKALLLLYFLLNNKIIDASNLLESLKNNKDYQPDEKLMTIIPIVNSYISILPTSIKKLALYYNSSIEKKDQTHFVKKVSLKPELELKGISVTSNINEVVSYSDAIRNLMEQLEDIKVKSIRENTRIENPLTPFRKKMLDEGHSFIKESPFIRSALSESVRSINLNDSLYSVTKVAKFKDSVKKSVNLIDLKKDDEITSLLKTPQRSISKTVHKHSSKSNLSKNISETPTSILKGNKSLMSEKSILSPILSVNQKDKTTRTRLRFSIPGNQSEKSNEQPLISEKVESTSSSNDIQMKSEDDEFKLSEPTLSNVEPVDTNVGTPKNLPNFVFSPPLTRSRSKKKNPKQKNKLFSESLTDHHQSEEPIDENPVPSSSSITSTPPKSLPHSMQLRTSSVKKKSFKKK